MLNTEKGQLGKSTIHLTGAALETGTLFGAEAEDSGACISQGATRSAKSYLWGGCSCHRYDGQSFIQFQSFLRDTGRNRDHTVDRAPQPFLLTNRRAFAWHINRYTVYIGWTGNYEIHSRSRETSDDKRHVIERSTCPA